MTLFVYRRKSGSAGATFCFPYNFYLPPGSLAGDYNLHHVCTRVHACVHVWVTQFSLKLLQLHIFGNLLVLMNFYALQNFFGFVNFGLLLSE